MFDSRRQEETFDLISYDIARTRTAAEGGEENIPPRLGPEKARGSVNLKVRRADTSAHYYD